eukprot:TRINITY_DN2604_c0_g1_i3.p1 TRINITY_DN2604_c0_g1~~TRINITY_DN2604_c0_g1_i3.p1  ORF type:complete len:1903 (+),score=348.42 TRINITY_DN2604_c0_g1_i3:342-6050(+)
MDSGVASDDSGGDQADGDDTGQNTMDHAVIGGASRNFLADVAMATERVDSLLSRIDAPQVQHDPDDPDAGWDDGRPITQLHQVQFHVAVESQQRSEVVQNLKKLHGNLHAQATHESLQGVNQWCQARAGHGKAEAAALDEGEADMTTEERAAEQEGTAVIGAIDQFRDNEQQKLQALHMKIKNMHREWEEMVRKEEDAIRRQRDEQQLRTLMEIEHASDRLTHLKEEHMSLQAQLDRAIARAAVEPSEACNQSLQRYAKKATYLMGAIRQQQQWITAALEGAEEAEADGKRLNADLKVLAEMERAALAAHHQHQQQGKQQSGGLQALTILAGLKRQLEREMKTLAVADEMASRQRPLLLAEQEQLLREVQAGNAAKHAREQLEASAARRVAEVDEQSAPLAAAAEAAAAQLAELQPKLLALFAQHMYAEPEHTSSSSSDESGSGTDSEDLSDDGTRRLNSSVSHAADNLELKTLELSWQKLQRQLTLAQASKLRDSSSIFTEQEAAARTVCSDLIAESALQGAATNSLGAGAADAPAPEAQRREQLAAGLQEGALRVAALHRAAVAAAAPATTAAAADLMNLIRGTSSTTRAVLSEPLQAPVLLQDSTIRALSGAAAWKLLHVAHKAGTLSDAEVASVKTHVLWQGQELSRDNCQLVHDLDTALGEAMTGPRSQQGSPAAVPLIHTGHLGRVAVEYQAASMAVQGFMHVAGCNMMMQALHVTRCSADNDNAATSIMQEGTAEAMRQVVTLACTGHGLTGAAALLCAVTLGQLCINSRTEVTSAAPPEWQLPSALHKVVMAAAAAAATPAQRQQQQDQSVTSAPGVGNSERGQGRQEVSTPQIAESRPTAQLLTGGMRSVLLAVAALCDLRSGFHSVMDTDAAAQLAQQMVKVLVTFEQDSASPAPSLRASLLTSSLSSVTAWLNKLRGLTAAARNFILQCDAKPSLQPCKLAVMEALLHLHGLTTSSSGPTEQLVQLYLTAQVEPESMVDMVEMPAARLRPGTSPDSNLFHSRSFEAGHEERGINTSQREHMYQASESSDSAYRRSRRSASGAISSDLSDSTPRDSWETAYSQTTGSMVDVASSPRESKVVSGASRASSCSDAGGQRAGNSQLRAAAAAAVAATGGPLLRPHRPLAPALTISTPATVPVDNTTSSGSQPETSCGGSQVGSRPGTGCESSRPGSASLQERLSAAMSRQGSNSGLATACDHPAMASQAADSSRVKSEDAAAAAAAVAMLLGNTRRSGYHRGGVSQHQMVSTPQVTGDPVAAPSCRQRSTSQASSPRASTVLRPASPRGSTIVRGSFASAASATSLVASHTPSSTSRVRDDEGMSGRGHSPRASSSPQVLSPRNSASVLARELSTKGCAPGLGAARSPRTSVMSAASDGLVRRRSRSNRGPADTPNPPGHAASLRSMAAARRVGPDLLSAVTQALDSPIMHGPPLEDVLSNHGAHRRSICGQFTEGWLALQEALQASDDQGAEVDVSQQINGMEREALLLQKMREQMAALFAVPFNADSTRPNAAVSASQEHPTIYKYQPPQGLSSQSMLALMSKLLSELGKLHSAEEHAEAKRIKQLPQVVQAKTALRLASRRQGAMSSDEFADIFSGFKSPALMSSPSGNDIVMDSRDLQNEITVLEVQLDTLKAELAAMDTDTARAKQEEQDLKALQHQEYTLAKLLAAKTLLLGTTPKDEASRNIANLKQELYARNDELQDILYKLRLIRSDPKRLASGAGLEGVLMTPEERADLDARLKRMARRARALQRVVSALRRKWDTFKAQIATTEHKTSLAMRAKAALPQKLLQHHEDSVLRKSNHAHFANASWMVGLTSERTTLKQRASPNPWFTAPAPHNVFRTAGPVLRHQANSNLAYAAAQQRLEQAMMVHGNMPPLYDSVGPEAQYIRHI